MRIKGMIDADPGKFANGSMLIRIDSITGFPVVIEGGEHRVHLGRFFEAFDSDASIGTLIGDHLTLQFTTPAATAGLVHAIFDAYVGAAYQFQLREGQTGGGTGGVAIPVYNHRRSSSNTPGFTIYKDSTEGTGGTLLIDKYFSTGEGPFATGQDHRSHEWILKPATIYQVRVFCLSAVVAHLAMEFYLQTDINTPTGG